MKDLWSAADSIIPQTFWKSALDTTLTTETHWPFIYDVKMWRLQMKRTLAWLSMSTCLSMSLWAFTHILQFNLTIFGAAEVDSVDASLSYPVLFCAWTYRHGQTCKLHTESQPRTFLLRGTSAHHCATVPPHS